MHMLGLYMGEFVTSAYEILIKLKVWLKYKHLIQIVYKL